MNKTLTSNHQHYHQNYGSVNDINNEYIPHNSYIPSHPNSSLSHRIRKPKPRIAPNTPSPYFRPYSPALTSKSALTSPQRAHIQSPIGSNHEHTNIKNDDTNQITIWQAGFTVINLFLGLCLLSYPYALSCGSFISLIPFLFVSFALCYTGKLIVRCFDSLSSEVEQSYPMVGYYSFNNFGYLLISIGICAELFGALCTNTIFLWTNLSYLLTPYFTMNEIILICVAACLPTCWILNFNDLSINSFLGCLCKIFTAVVVVITFFLNQDEVTSNITHQQIKIYPQSIQSFCIAMGIYVMSFSGHPCLPSIYRAMKQPEKFEKMLDYCFVIMCASYILISVFGYLTFAGKTNIIITGNLLHQNEYLSKTLIILVVSGCYFQVSPLIAVMAEIPENNVLKIQSKNKIRLFRTFLFLFICAASYVSMDKLQYLEAITGSICTMIVSVICPALFYYKLFLSEKKQPNKKIIMPATYTSPIFGAKRQVKKFHCPLPDDMNVNIVNIHNDNNENDGNHIGDDKLGLRIVLYSYVIIGTIIGCYMFVTDLVDAMNQ